MENPKAVQDLVHTRLGDETVVYTGRRHEFVRLNPTASVVWQACDGRHTTDDLLRELQTTYGPDVSEEAVHAALEQLHVAGLLETPAAAGPAPENARRQFLRRAVTVGALTVAMPVVEVFTAPSAFAAASEDGPRDVPRGLRKQLKRYRKENCNDGLAGSPGEDTVPLDARDRLCDGFI